jgi:hypothetical protein
MPGVLVSCPRCGKGLKLRDRSKLGRPGRCPACQHTFVLTEPEEVELELADAVPAVGTGARWVPDDEPASEVSPPAHVPPRDLADEFPQLDFDAPPLPHPAGAPLPPLVTDAAAPGTSTLDELRRRRTRSRRTGIIVGGLAGAGIAAVILAVVFATPAAPPRAERPKRKLSATYEGERAALGDNLTRAREASPTDGDPIRLMSVPDGAFVVVHLRPAELWSDEPRAQEFRACFSEEILSAVEAWIRDFCRFEPDQIEELLVCFLLRPRDQSPGLAAVVRTVEKQRKSELLQKFPGELNEEHGFPVYVADGQAYLFSDDLHTISIAPSDSDSVAELAASATTKQPATSKDGILDLLRRSDRERHITVVFDTHDVRLRQPVLVPEKARPALGALVDWLGDDIETVAWSVHRAEDRFFSQIYLRNQHEWTPTQLQADVRQKLRRLPLAVYQAVEKMQPPTVGARMLIGRFPAMVKVFALQTLLAIGPDSRTDRWVQLTTVLPERAAPNLVLAGVLTWDESTRTDFSQQAPTQPSGPKLPETVAERLRTPIEIDFIREPLESAFQYIGRETSVGVELDGEGLEAAGVTRNAPQSHAMGTVPAIKGIAAILTKHEQDGLCIVVDEARKTMIVTTKAAAAQRGEQPFVVEE